MSFTYAELSALLAGLLWPLARIAGLVAAAPILGNIGVPRRVKILLALAITVVIAPHTGNLPSVDPWSGQGLILLAQQMLIGTAMGLAMRLVFTMVDVAGELIGLQMGLGFATFFDPQHGAHTPVIAQFLGLLASLIFLAVNGHLIMLSILADSFRLLPVSVTAPHTSAWLALTHWGGHIFASGLMLALPVIVTLLITNIAIGMLTRAAPQLNLFAVGFPVTILVGWIALALTLPTLLPVLSRVIEEGLRMMLGLFGLPLS